jgi:hypothetical protein
MNTGAGKRNVVGSPNRRGEPRLYVTFPIEVSGLDRRGKFFTERTSSTDFGDGSCAFLLLTEVEQDSVLAVRSFHWQNQSILDSRPVLFQVVRIERQAEKWLVGTIKFLAEREERAARCDPDRKPKPADG